ncbi:MAG: SEC-C domain-containing protein [Lactobacillales bacterium]|nr:SEC-C domain-containing protein [Lactobacillales bacterium]
MDAKQYLKGTIEVSDTEHTISKSYLIEIHFTEGFPYRFPKLYEVGGDIPCEADFHKYSDSSCCITAFIDELFKCKNSITVLQFVKEQVIPYLANQWYRQITGEYKNEYSHGDKGQVEGLYDYAFGEKKNNLGRNDECFCGSNKKYKKCCLTIISNIQLIGKERILQFINSI